MPAPARAQTSLPDPSSTPGAINPSVTQANIATTICLPGWTHSIRPPSAFTSALKRRQLQTWHSYGGGQMRDFEEDHLIPLELGGAPIDPHNLWPEPRKAADGWNAAKKDDLEGVLNRMVCSGQLPLVEAQRAIAGDWHVAYLRYGHLESGARAIVPRQKPGAVTGADQFYHSSDGTLVHRPTVWAVPGATVSAICADGTSSYSHHHQGTCSHHGGVSEWK